MSSIVLTDHFKKQLGKTTATQKEVVYQVGKYGYNTNAYIGLGTYDEFLVCKDYLQGGKVRLIVFTKYHDVYLPVIIVPKNSKKGNNIRKDNIEELFGLDIEKVLADFENGKFEVIKIDS